jgi:hypothetical protein
MKGKGKHENNFDFKGENSKLVSFETVGAIPLPQKETFS